MTKVKKQLYSNGKKIYPITISDNVMMEDGSTLTDHLNNNFIAGGAGNANPLLWVHKVLKVTKEM